MTFSSSDTVSPAVTVSGSDSITLASERDGHREPEPGSDSVINISPADTAALVLDPDIYLVGPDSLYEPSIDHGEPVDGVAVMMIGSAVRKPHLIYVNDGLCQLVGWSVEQLIGQSPAFLFSGSEGPRQLDALADAILSTVESSNGESSGKASSSAGPADSTGDLLDLLNDPRVSGTRPLVRNRPEPGDQSQIPNGAGGSATLDLDRSMLDLAQIQREANYESVTILANQGGQRFPAFFSAQAISSPSPGCAYVVAQFRDLRKAAAERLLADQEAVIASLRRGHHLGQLCHQIAAMIERSLGVDATCWVSITNPGGQLEPVIVGGFDPSVVAESVTAISQSSARQTKRIASVAGLRDELAVHLEEEGIGNLWYVPVMVDPLAAAKAAQDQPDGPKSRRSEVLPAVLPQEASDLNEQRTPQELRGAIVVATGDSTPDGEATKLLDHLAQVLVVAIDHASAESDNAYQALHDPLTQLPNRALIVDRLKQAMARLERDSSSLSVLLVDIDRFKALNDIQGVDVGDQVLVEVADRLLAAVRLGDTVGRISSDQYLVMCVATNGELDTAAVARRILRSLADPIRVDSEGQEVHITASIGAVLVAEAEQSPAEVISNAESALAKASAAGRGQFTMFEAEHQHDVVRRHETEQALRKGIGNDELVLHYQPLVEVRSGFMIGAEALVRWQRPGYGLLSPGEFIPVAEDADLIVPLGEWVIDKACEDLAKWPKVNGRSPLVSINLAARHLEVDTLVPTVIRALQRNNLKPNRIGFEITESMAVLDTEAALVNLNKISGLGCRIAIDDFGIGHASLDYLRRFSMANAIKIDRSFIAGLPDSKEDEAIVKASLAMADALDLQVVAEGVETVEQLLRLRDLGCRYAQGYVLSRPIPFEIVLEVWARSRLYSSA